MHDTAYRIGALVMDTYLPSVPARILEVGALNVNGTLRDHAPRNAEYTGLDFEAGEGVDIVITGLDDWNVPDAHFDLVMASSVFEHDSAFWRTFLVMCRKTKPGGYIYVSAPSNGTVHRYPRDCWRFYPDAGLCLAEWARDEAFEVTLIESFVAERESDGWNDFCAVFQVGPCSDDLNRDFVYDKVRSSNAINWRSSLIINGQDETEDARLLRAAREEVLALQEALKASREESHVLQLALQTSREEGHALQQGLQLSREEVLTLHGALGEAQEAQAALEQARAIADTEKTNLLAFHAEEIEARTREISDLIHEVGRQNTELARFSEEARAEADLLDDQITHLKSVIAELEGEREDQVAVKRSLVAEINELVVQKSASEQRLQERFREIAGLTRLIRERDQIIDAEQTQMEWLRRVVSVLTWSYSRSRKARLATWLPTHFSHKRQKTQLKRQGLFDPDAYAARYPDVSRDGADPLRHYINHGMKEGRIITRGS